MMASEVQKQLVVFDFDWSMADQDTDRWIFEVLAPDLRRKMKTLKDQVQWTDLSKGLQNLFEEIVTNPAAFEPSGLLKLRRRVDPTGPQHQCKVGCSPNMCKGEELEAFLARHQTQFDRIIYIGDGANDFCPILRMRSQDMVLCRRFRGLERRIAQEGASEGLKCQVQYWAGAWEVEEIFGTLSA
ncbi:hypothetical protein ID866_1424 [Astraeus odoratus]|nr:hypothetical protein ID866_1424 [Astraeus odoratus]